MNISHKRELKVALLAIVCGFLLFYGFFFLKGVNIFSSSNDYHGVYASVGGLTEQAPVLIKGYKVGQVNHIHYDFTQDSAFIVDISIHKDIVLPRGTEMRLVANGLLGGTAVELYLPKGQSASYHNGDTLPTVVVPGLVDQLQTGMLEDVDQAVIEAKELLAHLNNQLAGDQLKHSLTHIEVISSDLQDVSARLKVIMANQVPGMVNHADSMLANLDQVSSAIRDADIQNTISQIDTAVAYLNAVLAEVNSTDGTIGKLVNDSSLYVNVNAAIVSADSLLVDLKANPRRYVHFSLFGGKDKSDKKKK